MKHTSDFAGYRWADISLPEKSAAIIELVSHGQSARQMAIALSASRSMILSHARRHNIRLANLPSRRTSTVYAAARHTMRVHPPVPDSTWEAHRAPIGLLELTDYTCCWPVGEGKGANQLFCGDDTHTRGHCERHWRMRGRGMPAQVAAIAGGTTIRDARCD